MIDNKISSFSVCTNETASGTYNTYCFSTYEVPGSSQ